MSDKKTKYDIQISVKLANLSKPIQDLEESLNNTLSDCGVSEKLGISSRFNIGTMETAKELTTNEKERIITLMEAEFIKSHPEWDAKIQIIPQSVTQSAL